MTKMYDEIRWELSKVIAMAIAKVNTEANANGLGSIADFGAASETMTRQNIAEALIDPPNTALGDLAYGCFSLSKMLKKSPAEIAKKMAEVLGATKSELLKEARAVGPYLNLFVSSKAFDDLLLDPIITPASIPEIDPVQSAGSYFQKPIFLSPPKTMIEFCSQNTHKELHVGHMRNICLGDALIRLHRFSGFEIVSSNFPGDVGTHVAKCLWYLKFHNQEPVPATNKGEWLGRMYSQAYLQLEKDLGSAQESVNREKLTQILKELEEKKGEFFELWKETRQWSIDLMNQVYEWAGVSFDMWYWESDVDSESIKYVKSLYHQKRLIQSQGAVGIDLEADGLGFCMLMKSDGTGLYATKDLELARRKFQDFDIQRSIYVVDLRQTLHFKQVFKVLEKLGFPQAANCYHLPYNFVELPDGPMSSRKGNIVPITALILEMQDLVKRDFLNRYAGIWSEEEIDQTAVQIAQGAIKYGMLRIDPNKKIVFDMKEWLKIDGESGPFIQYSVARIRSLCSKLGYEAGPIQPGLLIHPSEREVLAHLLNFKLIVGRCVEGLSPSPLCTYLFQLAKKFNHFYHECPIGRAENDELKKARLKLVKATGEVLATGLRLLGITSPERM